MQTQDNQVVGQAQRIISNIRRVVVGKDQVLLWVLAAILAKGHILLEDIPGVGKTTMALAFSRTLGLSYNRVQFTPDVLPSDVTGYSVLNQATGRMTYQPGAVLHNTSGSSVQIDLAKITNVPLTELAAVIGVGGAALEGSVLTLDSQTSVVVK